MSKETARARRILQFFKLTIPEWNSIDEYQGFRCFLCRRAKKPGKNLSTDHCHKTGLVRGLLCNQCNRLLGRIERHWGHDIAAILERVILYLKDPPAARALGRQVFTFAGRLGTKRHRAALKKESKI